MAALGPSGLLLSQSFEVVANPGGFADFLLPVLHSLAQDHTVVDLAEGLLNLLQLLDDGRNPRIAFCLGSDLQGVPELFGSNAEVMQFAERPPACALKIRRQRLHFASPRNV